MAMNQLLELLDEEGNLPVSQIAVMLGETEEAVAKQIAQYERDGVIKGYHALINWEKADVKKATALIELRVTPKKDTGFDEVANHLLGFPEVRSVSLMSGGFDLAVTVTARSMSDIAMFVAKRLSCIEGVLSTATHFVLTKYKERGVIMNSEDEEIDERGSNLCD